jgi:hypothetical protein
MSLDSYNTLNNLEVSLPKLTAATLHIESKKGSISDVFQAIDSFSAQQGWVQYRDGVSISVSTPSRNDIIEAQYCDSNDNSLHIKLLNNEYLITKYLNKNEQSTNQVFSEQLVALRNNLKSNEAHNDNVVYRLWWQQADTGVAEGSWTPQVQQFMGFDVKSTNNKESN